MCNPQALLSLSLFKSEGVKPQWCSENPSHVKTAHLHQSNKEINQSLPRLERAVCAWSCDQAQWQGNQPNKNVSCFTFVGGKNYSHSETVKEERMKDREREKA